MYSFKRYPETRYSVKNICNSNVLGESISSKNVFDSNVLSQNISSNNVSSEKDIP